MSNKDYYERWLKIKNEMNKLIHEDARIQRFAENQVGLKPQATAVEIVARVYAQYCVLYNKLCDTYDQMQQVQRAEYLRKIIDAMTCRILELKNVLQKVEAFEITYPDNALVQLVMIPEDIQIMAPFFYAYETREQEMQYIVDQIFAGNRLGDPPLSQEEIERIELQRSQMEQLRKQKEAAEKSKEFIFTYSDSESETVTEMTPEEIEALRLWEEHNRPILDIQRMERSRSILRFLAKKEYKSQELYLELSGNKKPPAKEIIRIKAAQLIQVGFRNFMYLRRKRRREEKLKERIDMTMSSWSPLSAKIQLDKVKEARREYRRKYYQDWVQANIKEKTRVLRVKKNDIMEDISDEIREWFLDWYTECKVFDEFPYPGEGGSILIVRGETMTIPEYLVWQEKEIVRLKSAKEEVSQSDKELAKEQKRALAKEEALRAKKKISDYKKQRKNPLTDPGVFLTIGKCYESVAEAWHLYESEWKNIDTNNPVLDAVKGYMMSLVTEEQLKDLRLELRSIVDEAMILEHALLKAANARDYAQLEVEMPPVQKRKKPRRKRLPKPDKISPETMFQMLVDKGIVKKYPKTSFDDFWGDRNYAVADARAIPWKPKFPSPCLGDVKEQVRLQCLLALGSTCREAVRSQLIIGPKYSGKKTLVYAVASETNSILIDLSPNNTKGKFVGRALKRMFNYVNKISRLMQPTVILVENADQVFYKRLPLDAPFDPTQLNRDFFRELVKPLKFKDKVLILGTAVTPWLSKPSMKKAFKQCILMPRTDYSSIYYILMKLLMPYHGVDREFDTHSTAHALIGYDVRSIRNAIDKLMDAKRIAKLSFQPLEPQEIVGRVLYDEETVYTSPEDYELYVTWYRKNSPWGKEYAEMIDMLECQLAIKVKNEKKVKPKPKPVASSNLSMMGSNQGVAK